MRKLPTHTSDMSSPHQSSPSLSRQEADFYYAGLPSNPILVYRTGSTPWEEPEGPEAYRELKELRPVFGHKLGTVWTEVAPQVISYLDAASVLWTSIDVVRFAMVKQADVVGPVVLWIGVIPGTLPEPDAKPVAHSCLAALERFGITDVEVEFRESVYTRSGSAAGPALLEPVFEMYPTQDVRGPLTPALGLSIAAEATPHVEGTGGIYLTEEGGGGDKLFLLTARHVLLPSYGEQNVEYVHTGDNAPRRNVLLLGTEAFDRLLRSISDRIRQHRTTVAIYRQQLEKLTERERERGEEEHDVTRSTNERMKAEKLLDYAVKKTEDIERFRDEVIKNWSPQSQRVLGHTVYSPPVTHGGTGGFCEDYAIVELDRSKIDGAFKGNVIDLGTS